MSLNQNQKGFGLVEVLLIIILILLVGFTGYYFINSQNKADNKADNKETTKTSAKSNSAKEAVKEPEKSDLEQIVEAVKEDGATTVTIDETQGDFARGNASGSEYGSGYAFVAKKEGGKWSVIIKGQESPSKSEGEKYGLPSGWYSTDY